MQKSVTYCTKFICKCKFVQFKAIYCTILGMVMERRDLASAIPFPLAAGLRLRHSLPARRGGAFKRICRMRAGQLCCPCFFLCVFLPGSKLPGEATHKKRHRCCDALISGVLLSGKRDSNPRPSAWEADALPTELFPQKHCKCRNFLPLFKDFLFPMSDFS